MKILLLVDDYLPSTKSAPLMIQQLGHAFLRHGDSATILAPSGRFFWKTQKSEENGLTVIRFRSGRLKNIGKIRRAFNELLLPLGVLGYWFFNHEIRRTELIVSYTPTIFWGPAIRIIKLFQKTKNYMILRDIFPQWVVDSGIIREHSPITRFFRVFENINYAAADIIGVQSPGCRTYFQNSSYQKKVKTLYNWVELAPSDTQTFGIRKQYHWDNKVIFFYGGNIGLAQDMDNLMRLARAMKDYPQAQFLFVGKGDAFDLLKDRITEWDLTNTLLLPPVPQEEYYQMLEECDVGMITLHPNHKTQNIPGKLLGYMTRCKPVLASVNPKNDLLNLIPQFNSGLVSVNPDDETLLNNAISLLDPNTRKKKGKGAYDMAKNVFDVNTTVKDIISAVT